jgi:putative membrane protein
MKLLSIILVSIVALEALFIMVLEMFLTQTPLARRAFDLSAGYLAKKEARVSMANQGLYNGFIGVGIFFSLLTLSGDAQSKMLYLFVGFVIVAAIFGALTANKKILISQGLPAILAMIVLLIAHY